MRAIPWKNSSLPTCVYCSNKSHYDQNNPSWLIQSSHKGFILRLYGYVSTFYTVR